QTTAAGQRTPGAAFHVHAFSGTELERPCDHGAAQLSATRELGGKRIGAGHLRRYRLCVPPPGDLVAWIALLGNVARVPVPVHAHLSHGLLQLLDLDRRAAARARLLAPDPIGDLDRAGREVLIVARSALFQ